MFILRTSTPIRQQADWEMPLDTVNASPQFLTAAAFGVKRWRVHGTQIGKDSSMGNEYPSPFDQNISSLIFKPGDEHYSVPSNERELHYYAREFPRVLFWNPGPNDYQYCLLQIFLNFNNPAGGGKWRTTDQDSNGIYFQKFGTSGSTGIGEIISNTPSSYYTIDATASLKAFGKTITLQARAHQPHGASGVPSIQFEALEYWTYGGKYSSTTGQRVT
ncbi:MAG: hypothetical protein QM627_12905 [Luteolibacter sp.]